jgi:hypothetical protein
MYEYRYRGSLRTRTDALRIRARCDNIACKLLSTAGAWKKPETSGASRVDRCEPHLLVHTCCCSHLKNYKRGGMERPSSPPRNVRDQGEERSCKRCLFYTCTYLYLRSDMTREKPQRHNVIFIPPYISDRSPINFFHTYECTVAPFSVYRVRPLYARKGRLRTRFIPLPAKDFSHMRSNK